MKIKIVAIKFYLLLAFYFCDMTIFEWKYKFLFTTASTKLTTEKEGKKNVACILTEKCPKIGCVMCEFNVLILWEHLHAP